LTFSEKPRSENELDALPEARTVNENPPLALGVPLKWPPDDSDSPDGSAPETIE
jgi:hypothetical protein